MIKFIYKRNYFKFVFNLIFFLFFIIFSNKCFASSSSKIPNLYCSDNVLMDAESGNVLFEKNGYQKVYPASTTKVLTSILVLENLNLDDTVVASKAAINSIPVGSSVMGIEEGEVYTVKNLLYGLLLPSGNDAAIVLAEAVSGNVKDFVNLMNKKAKEIGCLNTHFANPHGFYDPNHYTTAYDMSLILRYALKFDTFREICQTKTIDLPPTNKRNTTKTLNNTNRLIDESYSVFYEYALGGKTGYTIESRGTYIGYAKKDEKLIIVANFDGSQNINGQNARFLDAITLYDYGFNNFNKNKIIDKNDYKYTITDKNTNKKYTIAPEEDCYALTSTNNNIISTPQLNINFANDTLDGTITFKISGKSINANISKDIIITSSGTYLNLFSSYIQYVILILLVLILFILIKKRRK